MNYSLFENTSKNIEDSLDAIADIYSVNDLKEFFGNLPSVYEKNHFIKMFKMASVLTSFYDEYFQTLDELSEN